MGAREDIDRAFEESVTESEANPYHATCPTCSTPAVGSCRCMGPHSLTELAMGHGYHCVNGHHWSKQADGTTLVTG